MKISLLNFPDHVEAYGQRLQDVAQWRQGEKLEEKHFDRYASKAFKSELRKQLKKSAKRIGSQIVPSNVG